MHTCTHAHIRTYIHTYIHKRIHTHTCPRMYVQRQGYKLHPLYEHQHAAGSLDGLVAELHALEQAA